MNLSSPGHQSRVLHRNLAQPPRRIVKGEGVWLTDSSGERLLDAVGGAAVVTIGHGVESIYQSLASAASSAMYVYGDGFSSAWTETFASEVMTMTRWSQGAAYFVSGGSEANETAVKMARQYQIERGQPSRNKIIARWQSYHGVTLGMLAVSGRTSWRQPYDPYLFNSPKVASPYQYRCHFCKFSDSCSLACADDLERILLMEGPDTVAAFIAEPIVGTTATGVVPSDDYYRRVREICDRYEILFIADEVLSGYGRTGRPFALDHWGVEPDIITLGKGIGSGYAALGATIAAPHVVETIRTGSGRFNHGFTYSGLPAASVIGLAVLDYMRKHDLFERSREMGEYLHRQLQELMDTHEVIGDVRGKGMLAGVEFVADRKTRVPIRPEIAYASRIARHMEDKCRVIVRPGVPGINHGLGGDHIQISPPFVATTEDIDLIVAALDESIVTVNHQSY